MTFCHPPSLPPALGEKLRIARKLHFLREFDDCSPAHSLVGHGVLSICRQVVLNISVGLPAGAASGGADGTFGASGGTAKAAPATTPWSTQVGTRLASPGTVVFDYTRNRRFLVGVFDFSVHRIDVMFFRLPFL